MGWSWSSTICLLQFQIRKWKLGNGKAAHNHSNPLPSPTPQRLLIREFFLFDVRQVVNRKHYRLLNVHVRTQTVLETTAIVSTIIESKSPSPIFVPLQMRSTTVLNEQTPPPLPSTRSFGKHQEINGFSVLLTYRFSASVLPHLASNWIYWPLLLSGVFL